MSLKYAFFYVPMFDVLEDGWQAYTPEAEMSRYKECSEEWRLSYINKDFKVSVENTVSFCSEDTDQST